ncbi:hypothetical protein JTE90_023164 [Oedothorax gibbosus]|uniref:Uncharacterized protein n=1 Tax=Oedothorax gibbosus TaxID=931172 RepID=A0AAV6UQH6_9ARAC|nr:hypothetical protein JTE90_023164 [Oedothorax gibbosus]
MFDQCSKTTLYSSWTPFLPVTSTEKSHQICGQSFQIKKNAVITFAVRSDYCHFLLSCGLSTSRRLVVT